jgi:LacI family transcriptional regulator
VTQQDIARMAGVSQATVSLVLNGRGDPGVRIAADTRERVMQAIIASGYVLGPVARRLSAARDRVIGVLTGEPAFPIGADDFYHPILVGIEERAEQAGGDVLLLTGITGRGRRRPVAGEPARLHRADGCLLLGRYPAPDEVPGLLAAISPCVAVGRRDDPAAPLSAGDPLSYVGADYVTATADMVARVAALGHRRLAYVGDGAGIESLTDRMTGFRHGVEEARLDGVHLVAAGREPGDLLADLRARSVTAVLAESHADGAALVAAAAAQGLGVPADLSVVVLGDRFGSPRVAGEPDLTGLSVPRHEMGRQAAESLYRLLDGAPGPLRSLLACDHVAGTSLGPAA